MKTRAAVALEKGKPLTVTDVELDGPKASEVLVEIKATGIGAVLNTAKVEPGYKSVVFGLGGIGLNVIQGLRLAGADMIIGVDINNGKKEWGASA